MAALAAMGYFVAAAYFYKLAVGSVFLVLGALLLYGLIAPGVQGATCSRLAPAPRRGAPATDGAAAAAAQGAAAAARRRRARRADAVALQLLITLLLVAGVVAVARAAGIGDYTLWTYHDTVDGRTVSHPLTVAGLFLALIVAVVTAVGVRNIGALLDIVLLQRLDVQPGRDLRGQGQGAVRADRCRRRDRGLHILGIG